MEKKSGIDSDYLKVRVKEVEEAVKELVRLTSKPFGDLSFDGRQSMRYQVIVLAEAIGSICIHISMEDLGYEPETYSDCIAYLRDKEIVGCAEELIKIIRMRNLLVHRYWVVDDFRVYSSVKENFKCVEEFSNTVKERYGLR
ncbi:MAG: DUF86 domain-containing protein [Methanophagales archaeon]|nr:DUF86 domain-containing protein [Methanophagales archaeon]